MLLFESSSLQVFNLVILVFLCAVFYFFNTYHSARDGIFLAQKWTFVHVAIFLILLKLWGLFVINSEILLGVAPRLLDMSSFILYPVMLWLFFSYIGQPISAIGLSRKNAVPLIHVGIIWLLWIEVAVHFIAWFFDLSLLGNSSGWSYLHVERIIERSGILFGLSMLFLVFSGMVLVSIFEEIVYRGLLYSSLRKHINANWAMGISSLLFMWMHDFVAFGPLFFGILLAILYEQYQSLIPGLIVHVGWNAILALSHMSGATKAIPSSRFHLILMSIGLLLLGVSYSYSFFMGNKRVRPRKFS